MTTVPTVGILIVNASPYRRVSFSIICRRARANHIPCHSLGSDGPGGRRTVGSGGSVRLSLPSDNSAMSKFHPSEAAPDETHLPVAHQKGDPRRQCRHQRPDEPIGNDCEAE